MSLAKTLSAYVPSSIFRYDTSILFRSFNNLLCGPALTPVLSFEGHNPD